MKKILFFLFMLFALPTLAQETASADTVRTLYGVLRYSEAETQEYGLMQLQTVNDVSPVMVWKDTDMVLMGNGGAVYVNGVYYVLSYMDFFGSLMATYVGADPETQTYRSIGGEIINITYSYIASDMTYDATTGKVYAASLNSKGDGTFVLSTMDLASASKKPIGAIRQLCALAADKNGQLYGIDNAGILCTVDKATAQVIPIGHTGVKPTADCSAAFDPVSGALYWSAYTETGGALYRVDVTTGKAHLVNVYPQGQQITGLFFEEPEKPQGAPMPVEYSAVEFEKASLAGTIHFELPTKDVADNELSGALSWKLKAEEELLASGEGQPGDVVAAKVELPIDGLYRFAISVANEVGSADDHFLEHYVGYDTPQKPEQVTLVANDGMMNLTWQTLPKGVNGGYVDLEALQHRVVRLPDGVVVAEAVVGNSFTEVLPLDGVNAYYYQVTPKNADYVGEYEFSNVDTVGYYMNVPLHEDFENVMRYILYTSVDANGDECYWTWTTLPEEAEHLPCATYMWGLADENDDWLVSPPIRFEQGKQYTITYHIRGEADAYAGTLQPFIGASDDMSTYSPITTEPMSIDFACDSALVVSGFSVPTTTDQRLALRVGGARSHYYIYLKALDVVEGTTSVNALVNENAATDIAMKGNVLTVDNRANQPITVVSATGKLWYKGVASQLQIPLPTGVYVVKKGGATVKVISR